MVVVVLYRLVEKDVLSVWTALLIGVVSIVVGFSGIAVLSEALSIKYAGFTVLSAIAVCRAMTGGLRIHDRLAGRTSASARVGP